MAYTIYKEPNRAAWIGVRPGVQGEQIVIDATVTNGTGVLYTVGVGKTLLLFRNWCSMVGGAAAAALCYYGVYDATPALVYKLFASYVWAPHAGADQDVARYVPLELSAGYNIRLTSPSAAEIVRAGIEGILVDPLENL